MLGSSLSLVIGVLIGLSALAAFSGFGASPSLVNDILFHPDIMVYGVIGGLLITEKLESMERFRLLNTLKISTPTIFSLFTGTAILSIGYQYGVQYLVDAGLVLVIIAGFLFLYFLTSKMGHSIPQIRWMFGASAAAIVLSAISNMKSPIWMNVQLSYLALLFPIIYIIAERVELGFVRGMSSQTLSFQATLSWLVVIMAFISAEIPGSLTESIILAVSIFFLFLVIVSALRFDPSFHRMPQKGKFQSYLRIGVMTAYFWLFFGLLLFTIQLTTSQDILDEATHSIALGFIGTFIVAHSPIIFPLTLKKRAEQNKVTFLPLLLITAATAMRVFGDIGANVLTIFNLVSYVSGYVLIVAIFAFIYNLRRITSNLNDMPPIRHITDAGKLE